MNYESLFNALLADQQKLSVAVQIARHLARVSLYELKGIDALYPDLRDKAQKLILNMKTLGKPVYLVDSFRSAKKQDELFKQVPPVTKAKALQSWHQFGFAADLVFVGYNWNPPKDDWWMVLKTEAEKLGLESGASWVFVDKPHVQLKGYGSTPTEDLQSYFRL